MSVDDKQVMAEESAGSPRNGDAEVSTNAHISVDSPNDVGDETVPRARALPFTVGGDGDRERNLVSRFGRLGSTVLPELDVHGGERGRIIGVAVPGTSAAGDGGF